ncbi:MAG: hypothetical protein CMJ83_17630 [Planctomycetes bacterium]|nr:hypothetical protein [Planctomycetota bacterium]
MALRALLLITLGTSMALGQSTPRLVAFHKAPDVTGERWAVFDSRVDSMDTTISVPSKEPMVVRSTTTRSTVADGVGTKTGVRIHYSHRHDRSENSFMLERIDSHDMTGRAFHIELVDGKTRVTQEGKRPPVDAGMIARDAAGWWAPRALHRVIPDRPVRVGEKLAIPTAVASDFIGALVEDENEHITSLVLTLSGVRDARGIRAAAFAVALRLEGEMTVDEAKLALEVAYTGEMLVTTDSCRLLSIEATGTRKLQPAGKSPKPRGEIRATGVTVLSRKIIYSR